MVPCSRCGNPAHDAGSPVCPFCAAEAGIDSSLATPINSVANVELDHRGVRMPARIRGGGIITPQ